MLKQDFDQLIAQAVAHRPYPLPSGPWVMRQSWHDLLFAHWPIATARLRAIVPPELPLDTFDRTAWIGVVPFRMSNVTLRGVPPVPWVSDFPELNVRTYVTLDDKPGVYFFSLDAGSPAAVGLARILVGLPYYFAQMNVETVNGVVHYRSARRGSKVPAEFDARYHPAGHPVEPARGSLEYFLTERYCLYTVHDGAVSRLDIHHRPWPLQPAEVDFDVNTMTRPIGLDLPDMRPFAHFVRRRDMVAWLPVRR